MSRLVTTLLGVFSVALSVLFYFTTLDVAQNLSAQGCRMSWMSPSYVLQSAFDTSWTPLARRYSLWLYREVGWESSKSNSESNGVPVLFIPGNAGSSRQVRSVASSAARQFYISPNVVSPEFMFRSLKPLDFYAAEFNEDLSAFHGSTIESQISYASHAISYILSLYPPETSIIIMGHSMGGIVATSLLPSKNISAIITMSTPHILPPARFDSRIDDIYRDIQKTLSSDPTPIISLCGGATDMMIPSESCILPSVEGKESMEDTLRKSVFTSALEGAWTGVGHREMVWCHQVRWRVARAALEVGASSSLKTKATILDKWLRDGHTLPPGATQPNNENEAFSLVDSSLYEVLPEGMHLVLKKPRGSRTYLLPVSRRNTFSSLARVVLFVSQGSINGISPQKPLPFKVSVFACSLASASQQEPSCNSLVPTTLKLIPNPIAGLAFPIPGEGIDESEGVVVCEADIPHLDSGSQYLGVRIEDADGAGWVVGGVDQSIHLDSEVGNIGLFFWGSSVIFPDRMPLRTQVTFPNLLSHALIVYRIVPLLSSSDSLCADSLLPPIIMHTSHPSESHYFPVTNIHSRRILLHTHSPAPYISHGPSQSEGLSFTIYSSGPTGCASDIIGLGIRIDWSATVGRWASRYPTTLASWAVGVVALVIFEAWGMSNQNAFMPTVQCSFSHFSGQPLRRLLLGSWLFSFIPLPVEYYLGNRGQPLLSPIAPLLLLIATGLVYVSWWVLVALIWFIGKVGRRVVGRRRPETRVHRSTVISICIIFLVIFLFVPWQVAFLGCWLIHLYTCSSTTPLPTFPGSTPTPDVLTPAPAVAIPLVRVTDADGNENIRAEDGIHINRFPEAGEPTLDNHYQKLSNHNHNMHILLLMTWLLPLAAPVLAVWVRTLVTAGLTTPFDGDHFFLNVAPFLILVDFASWTPGPLFERQSFERRLSVRWSLVFLAGIAFSIGPRRAYRVFDAAKIAVGLMVVVRIGRRYWGGAPWSSVVDGKRLH